MMDPLLGRWLCLDPLAERYYDHSPYCYVGNNPIKRIDPDGMKWKDGEDGDDAKEARRLQNTAQNKIGNLNDANIKLDKQITEATKASNDKKVEKLLGQKTDNEARISELDRSIKDIQRLGDDTKNTFSFGGKTVSADAGYLKQGDDGVISIFNTGSSALESDASKFHEVRHGSQFLQGTMKVGENGILVHTSIGSQVNNEISGHRAQYGFGGAICIPSSTVSSYDIKGINFNYISNLTRQDGSYLYPHLRQQYLRNK